MDGFLEKKSGKSKLLTRNQRRYFKHEWTKLNYYNKKGDDMPRGSYDLLELHAVYLADSDPQRRTIALLIANRSVFVTATDPAEAQAWVQNLRVFGISRVNSLAIPIAHHIKKYLLLLIDVCLEIGTFTEGLFRISGLSSTVENICQAVYRNYPKNKEQLHDVASVATAIKRIIGNLPESILTKRKAQKFALAKSANDINGIVKELPSDNRDILFRLFTLIRSLIINSNSTLLTPKALAICWGPALSGKNQKRLYDFTHCFTVICQQFDLVFTTESMSYVTNEKVACMPSSTTWLRGTEDMWGRRGSLKGIQKSPSATLISHALEQSSENDLFSRLRKVRNVSGSLFSTTRYRKPKLMVQRNETLASMESKHSQNLDEDINAQSISANTNSASKPTKNTSLSAELLAARHEIQYLHSCIDALKERCEFWRRLASSRDSTPVVPEFSLNSDYTQRSEHQISIEEQSERRESQDSLMLSPLQSPLQNNTSLIHEFNSPNNVNSFSSLTKNTTSPTSHHQHELNSLTEISDESSFKSGGPTSAPNIESGTKMTMQSAPLSDLRVERESTGIQRDTIANTYYIDDQNADQHNLRDLSVQQAIHRSPKNHFGTPTVDISRYQNDDTPLKAYVANTQHVSLQVHDKHIEMKQCHNSQVKREHEFVNAVSDDDAECESRKPRHYEITPQHSTPNQFVASNDKCLSVCSDSSAELDSIDSITSITSIED